MDSHADSMLIESELIVPVSIEFRNDLSPDDFEQLCRLCGNSSPQLMPIFSADGNEHNLPDKIREHLPIIKVSKTDVLPLSICYQCASTLISWHELYYACKDADLRLNEIYSRFKLEKIEPEENLIEIDDDVDFSEHVDSYEPVEFPVKPATPLKPEVIIPSALSEETTRLTADFSKTTESNVCSKPIEIPLAVDNEARKSPSADTKNKWSAKPNWISGLRLVRVEKPYEPLARKCVVCHGDVRVSAANDVLCATCLRKEPKLLRLPPSETPGPSTTLRKYLGGGETGAQLQCDKCDFACDPLSQLFLAHLGAHAAKPKQTAHADAVECAKCRRTFAGKPSLIRHLRQHQPKRYSCSSCASAFRSLAQLKTHRKRHARVSLNRTHIFCDVCNKYFKSKKGFAYHQQKICVRFKCYICDLTFADASAMAAHSNANHNREPKAPARVAPDERTSEGSAQYADESPIVDVAPAQPDTVEDERCKEAPAKSQCSVCGKVVTAAVLPRHMILHTDAEPFTCALCGKSFKRKCSLQDHIMIEMGMKNYVCDVCGMKFLKQGYLNKHMNYHRLANGEFSGWACEQCGKRFSEKWRLGVHQRAVHKGGRFASCKCDICGKLFAERYMVRVHKHREHNGEELREHRCEVCDRRFVEQWMLRSHQRTAHRDGARRVYCELCGRTDHKAAECAHRLQLQQVTCALCGDAFATNGALREHVVSAHVAPDEGVAEPERSPEPEPTDDVLWVCAGCGQHCASKQQLRAHQQRNNCGKSERYDCGRCKRTFTSRCSLSNHAMLHHKESARLPFRCEFCAKEFAAEESLQLHLRLEKVCSLCDGVYPCNDLLKNHVFGEHNDDEADEAQSSAKPFRCKLCGKKFMRKQAMKNHMFAEMNLRRYVCEFCDKSYNYYSHLKEHLVSCHGEKEFLCGYCGKDFPTKKRFRDHVTLHSDEKPYACECGQTFKLPRYLNKHKKNCKLTNFGSIRSETVEILEVK